MSEIREIKNETTLSEIVKSPETNSQYLLFGIIIDISEPYKISESTNYTTKLKIIDPSFNYKSKLTSKSLKFHKFVHINIYSETPERSPRIQYVGDIIRLRRFKFKFTPKGELMGNMKKYSNWLIYSGKKNESRVSECFKNYEKNKNRELNVYERGRLFDLRCWNDKFFFQNSLKYVNWWTNFKNENCCKVDLILKCVEIDYKRNVIRFVDEERKKFGLQLKSTPNKIEREVIKLRCVDVVFCKEEDRRVIKLTSMSSCLLVPGYFYDARKFEKILSSSSHVDNRLVKLQEKFSFLKNYFILEDKSKNNKKKNVSAVKNIHSNKKVITIKELKEKLKKEENINKKFLIKGFIINYNETDPNKTIKKMELKTLKLSHFKLKQKTDKKYRIIFSLVLMLKDHTIEKDEFINVYITTESGDQKIFETWNLLPNCDEIEAWENIKESSLGDFESNLKSMKNPVFNVCLGIQILKTKSGKVFFKVVDTVFLPVK